MKLVGHDKPTPQEALAHYGVKGMKWGVSKAKSAGKTVREAQKKNDAEIMDARARHPGLKKEYKAAKKQYKSDKKEVGRREAKKALAPVKDKYYKNWSRSLDSTASESVNRSVDRHYNKKSQNPRTWDQILNDEIGRHQMKKTVREVIDG